MDQRNKNVKIQEQASEIEHLRAIIDQLKSQITTRKHAWQKKLKEREDRHNVETRKIRAEISVLQEQVLTAERMCQHKDSEARAANQKLKDVGSQFQYVEADIRNLRDQVKRLQGQNDQLKFANEGLVKKDFEKDAHMRELKQHMDVRNMCISEAESTIKEQTKALQKMEGYLHDAQGQVEVKDESVKSYARQIEQLLEEQGNLQRQIESLKGFINELEITNLDLMRLVDASNQRVVEEYRSRASNLLLGKRKEETISNNSMLDMTIRTNKLINTRPINSRSFSPMRSQESVMHQRTTDYGVNQLRSANNQPPNILLAQNFDTITEHADEISVPRMPIQEKIKPEHDYQFAEKGYLHDQPKVTNSVKLETQQIVERAGKMLDKLFTMNKKLGTRALVPQIEAPQEVTIERPQPLTVQNHRSSDFSRNFAKKSELTSPNQFVAIAGDARSKSQEDSFQNFQQTRSASQTSQVIGTGLQTAAQQILRSEPEMIFQSHTSHSFNSDKAGIGIRFKTQSIQQANLKDNTNLNFRAINKKLMRQELESVNRNSLNI